LPLKICTFIDLALENVPRLPFLKQDKFSTFDLNQALNGSRRAPVYTPVLEAIRRIPLPSYFSSPKPIRVEKSIVTANALLSLPLNLSL
jgi:hypothetical protein